MAVAGWDRNRTRGGFEITPGTVFVTDAIFQPFSPTRAASLCSSFEYARVIVRMNLIHGRSCGQFFWSIPKDFLICRAVVEALPVTVSNGNHVRGIFRNQLK